MRQQVLVDGTERPHSDPARPSLSRWSMIARMTMRVFSPRRGFGGKRIHPLQQRRFSSLPAMLQMTLGRVLKSSCG